MSEPRKSRRRWFQYILWWLLLVMLLASLGMSGFAVGMKRAREQKEAVEEIEKLGARVKYDYEVDQSGDPVDGACPPAPTEFRYLLGVDFLASVCRVNFAGSATDAGLERLKGLTQLRALDLRMANVTDAGLEHLTGLTQLQMLVLWHTQVTDAGLEHLKGLTQLWILDLDETNVTDGGLKRFQMAMPRCNIRRRPNRPTTANTGESG